MKRYILLFLLTFQMVFSQEIVVKGKAFNSGTFNDRVVYIIKKDTINKQRMRNDSVNASCKKNSKLEKKNNYSLQDLFNEAEVFKQIQEKKYSNHTDSLGNFEIKAKLSDTLFFESHWHTTEKFLVADLVKKKKNIINLELEPCDVWPSHPEKPTKLYVFIGKKINVWSSPSSYCNASSLTSRILSKYLVVKNIYGDFNKDTIHFTTFPPHSVPIHQNYTPFKISFSEYDYCLLYVLQYNGELIQTRFFDDVYLTGEGRWATPVKPKGLYNTIATDFFKPDKIDFVTPIEFEYNDMFFTQIKENFSEQYNKITDDKILVTHGFYVEDLFKIRKFEALKEYDYLLNDSK